MINRIVAFYWNKVHLTSRFDFSNLEKINLNLDYLKYNLKSYF